MKKMRDIKVGERVLLTAGEYSDYCMIIYGVAAKDFSPDDIINEFLALPENRGKGRYELSEVSLAKYLVVDRGLVEEQPLTEWYLGDSGDFKNASCLSDKVGGDYRGF